MTFHSTYQLGPDVSNVNGKLINAALAKRQHCTFAIFKVSEGTTFKDRLLAGNVRRAREQGLLIAGYHFLHHGSAASQAQNYVENLRKSNVDPKSVGHAVDVEKLRGNRAECTSADVHNYVRELRKLIGDVPVGVYSYLYYWHTLMGNPRLPENTWVWTATYVQPPHYTAPRRIAQKGGFDGVGVTPGYWGPWGHRRHYDLRQFTAKASCGGIQPCDVSVFPGNLNKLRDLFGIGKGHAAHHTVHSQYHAEPQRGALREYDKGRRVAAVQRKLGVDHDGYFGPATLGAVKSFQESHNLVADGIVGPKTHAALFVSHTPRAPKYPLPAGSYFGPKSGLVNSVSGYYSHKADLEKWQRRMKKRGWSIDVDGLYGPGTKRVARAFQEEKGLTVDGLIGPATWKAAWTEPIT